MSDRLHTALAALPARQLNLVAIGVVAIVALLAWTFALRAPLAHYRLQSAALATQRATNAALPPAVAAIPATAAETAPPAAAPDPLALIGALSRGASAAGVAVVSASPGTATMVGGQRRQTLDIAASGSYAAMLAWLDDLERSQPFVGIVELELQPDDIASRRRARLHLAIYGNGDAP